MRKETTIDTIVFILLLITGILIIIFYNRIIGAIITISSLLPVHQEVREILKFIYEERKKSNPAHGQDVKESQAVLQVEGDINAPVFLSHGGNAVKTKKSGSKSRK